ncbi:hypothetical protein BJY04DRAFT_219278 [Aspergillus karnatakaensis]|uniref:uncharacterized protein n=1 Tax=Aspergillus karnatakaensis TaxID=1810916 RepID=UPI003CCD7297
MAPLPYLTLPPIPPIPAPTLNPILTPNTTNAPATVTQTTIVAATATPPINKNQLILAGIGAAAILVTGSVLFLLWVFSRWVSAKLNDGNMKIRATQSEYELDADPRALDEWMATGAHLRVFLVARGLDAMNRARPAGAENSTNSPSTTTTTTTVTSTDPTTNTTTTTSTTTTTTTPAAAANPAAAASGSSDDRPPLPKAKPCRDTLMKRIQIIMRMGRVLSGWSGA